MKKRKDDFEQKGEADSVPSSKLILRLHL